MWMETRTSLQRMPLHQKEATPMSPHPPPSLSNRQDQYASSGTSRTIGTSHGNLRHQITRSNSVRSPKSLTSPRGKKLYHELALPRHQTAQLASLRTGHCLLNQYLHRFGHAEPSCCECNSGAIVNVEHSILHCPRYDKQLAKLAREVGVCGMKMRKLLGLPRMIHHT
jgi:hypothetical protein